MSPNSAYHGEHEFQSISISKAGISWEHKSRVVTSRLSSALTGLLQPGLLTLVVTLGVTCHPCKVTFPLEKQLGGFSSQWKFYKCTQQGQRNGLELQRSLPTQFLPGHQEAAALGQGSLSFHFLLSLLTWITQSSCVDVVT